MFKRSAKDRTGSWVSREKNLAKVGKEKEFDQNILYKNVFFKKAQNPWEREDNEWGNLSMFQMWLTAI